MSSGNELTSTAFRIRRVAARGVDLNENGKAVRNVRKWKGAGRNVHEKTTMSARPTPNGVNMHEKTATLSKASVDDEPALCGSRHYAASEQFYFFFYLVVVYVSAANSHTSKSASWCVVNM